MGELSGKVAIVTGASKGIGAAIARRFGEAGAAVAVNYSSDKDGADRLVDEIVREGGKAVAIQAKRSLPVAGAMRPATLKDAEEVMMAMAIDNMTRGIL